MPYKLNYFTFKGLGEPVRFMLAYCNVDFVDNRIEWEDWPEVKPTMPLHQMPVLEADGKIFHQCVPICRYLGNIHNIAGKNALENYEIDCAAETVSELRMKVAIWYYGSKKVKDERYDQLIKESIPFYLGKLEEQALKNDGSLTVKGRITWGDVYSIALFEYINCLMGYDIMENCKNLKRVYEKVMSNEGVKKYLKTRPGDKIPPFSI